MAEKIVGTGITPTTVANSILRRAFRDDVQVTPMKLQKLLFYVTCLYQRNTGKRLLTESFQPWRYGPVCRSVYDEFKGFGGKPITRYAQDALGNATAVDESSSEPFRKALNLVWLTLGGRSAVELSRMTHRNGSAWSQAIAAEKPFISNTAMAEDHTFDEELGI
ncbi:Panacea domain-containing protein [Bifidobacterium stellenboschense]|uniref:Phage protein n=1 Tax=Bifidobacterium stellenboschense TaxID=762211 RepID=A0A087DQQ8_9BIFI|nr:type II toxin-antitoxin system antitoxin SocA domain-containing protein [Bifidobacterium stellenboschense]KFI97858.1 phage protein [Bifidobacterium stellenboschense]